MTADDIIGVWKEYDDCIHFCVENQNYGTDNWEIFPEFECLQTSDV